MRVALIAPPFIAVPPKDYGGTELFLAHLADGLSQRGVKVRIYANGESGEGLDPDIEIRALYDKGDWPIEDAGNSLLKDMNHSSWAVADALQDCDVLHLNSAPSLVCTRFIKAPTVYTMHHPYEANLNAFYSHYPKVNYVAISEFQRRETALPNSRTIYHGIDTSLYECKTKKEQYLAFLGRIAPLKGPHLAIEVAKKAGVPLKIAGEIQPLYEEYWEQQVKPHVDGSFIQYVGEVGLQEKNELLSNAMALLFPIQWDEPFGLVMVEAMACGTPVLALPGGSVDEIVQDGVSGIICESVDEMVSAVKKLNIPAAAVREYVEGNFSLKKMVQSYKDLYEEVAAQPLILNESKGMTAA